MTASTRVGPLLQIFFTDHLVAQRRLSLQTVASYRDTFRLLLQFVHRESGIEPAVLADPRTRRRDHPQIPRRSGKRPRQHRRVSQPATHGDTLLLSHGRIA